jgi:hypothetical protein
MVRGAPEPEHHARTRGASTVLHRVTLDAAQVTERYRVAAQRAMSPGHATSAPAIVWTDGDAELLIRPGDARVSCRDGLVLIAVPVFTDQTGDAEVVVPFAVAGPDMDAGLTMATYTRARGPEPVLDRWGEAVIAATWDAVVALCADAVHPHVAGALRAADGSLTVVARADRRDDGDSDGAERG